MTSSVGRNDPCPCGSGRKYKQCHLREDESQARAASSIRAERTAILSARLTRHFEPVAAALEALHAGRLSESRLAAARALLRAAAPLAMLRYPADAFATAVATAAAALEDEQPWSVWESAAPLLAQQIDDQRDAWLTQILEQLETAERSLHEPLVTCAAVLLAGRRLTRRDPAHQPLFGEIFLEQLSEARGSPSLLSVAPEAAMEDDGNALESVRAALMGDQPPPLLTLDAWLWLDDALGRLLTLPPDKRSVGMADVVRRCAEEFGDGLRERAALLGVSARLGPVARQQARAIARAWKEAPARLLLALLQSRTRKVLWRSHEEQSTFAALATRADRAFLTRYAGWLTDQEESDAGDRMEALAANAPAGI